ncbi:MAG: hypothetical protein U0235_19830 [Polyangiaceae bacterium]
MREVLDVFVGGANVTARVGSRHATAALRDLGLAAADLGRRTTGKTIVRFYDEPWELCVERFGDVAALGVTAPGSTLAGHRVRRARHVPRDRRQPHRRDRRGARTQGAEA